MYSKNQIRESVRQRGNVRGLQVEKTVAPSRLELNEGIIAGGAIYHNPKFKMAVVPPAHFDRTVGSGFMDKVSLSFSPKTNPALARAKRMNELIDRANAKRLAGGMDNTPSPKGKRVAVAPSVERPKRGRPSREAREAREAREDDEEAKFKTPDKMPPKPRDAKRRSRSPSPDSEGDITGEEVSFTGKGKYRGGARQAQKLGRTYMKQMMELDPEMKQLVGAGLFDKFMKGLSEFAKGAAYPVKAISKGLDLIPFVPNPLKPIANVLKDVDDPEMAKDLGVALKTRGKGSVLAKTLQIANPNVIGFSGGSEIKHTRGGISMTIKAVERALPMPKKSQKVSGSGRSKNKRSSPWIDFVKQYARENDMKYGDALKEAGKHYKK